MKKRVLTALILIPPVMAALFLASPWPLFVLGFLVAVIAATEVRTLLQVQTVLPLLLVAALWGAYGYAIATDRPLSGQQAILSSALLFTIGCFAARWGFRSRFLAGLAALWPAASLLALVQLHASHGSGEVWNWTTPVLLAILPLWAGDTAAIFAGKAFGKHKLAPSISPNKTLEGGIANLLACILAGIGIGALIDVDLAKSAACGAACGIFGQAGDLFESYLKRRADLKDSGTLLPGHGGILDRIDSILFSAIPVALILIFWR